jgi:ferritin
MRATTTDDKRPIEVATMTTTQPSGAERRDSAFVKLLREQIGHEFAAQQQYIALAVWFDAHDLPQLAAHFYRQAVEERNHAMMMVQYMLDRDLEIEIPSVPSVRNDFADVREPLRLALDQEKAVTAQIEQLFKAARDAGDFLGEQFVLWFLKEQVEEVASMSTLVAVAERAGDTGLFQIEDFIAREQVGDAGPDSAAPRAAGGTL